jgi:hypothetical protein
MSKCSLSLGTIGIQSDHGTSPWGRRSVEEAVFVELWVVVDTLSDSSFNTSLRSDVKLFVFGLLIGVVVVVDVDVVS